MRSAKVAGLIVSTACSYRTLTAANLRRAEVLFFRQPGKIPKQSRFDLSHR